MNNREAEMVIALLLAAHGGCPACSKKLCKGFANFFPEHKKLVKESFELYFGYVKGLVKIWD